MPSIASNTARIVTTDAIRIRRPIRGLPRWAFAGQSCCGLVHGGARRKRRQYAAVLVMRDSTLNALLKSSAVQLICDCEQLVVNTPHVVKARLYRLSLEFEFGDCPANLRDPRRSPVDQLMTPVAHGVAELQPVSQARHTHCSMTRQGLSMAKTKHDTSRRERLDTPTGSHFREAHQQRAIQGDG